MIRNFISRAMFGQIKSSIEATLQQKLFPIKLNIVDESSGHSRGK